MKWRIGLLLGCIVAAPLAATAWDAYGHRTITYLALDGLSPDMPGWLRDPVIRDRITSQANEPDRWKGWPADQLQHINKPDHYLDVEQLKDFGLTLESMPRLRREYLRAMAVAKHVHPENVRPYDATHDPARVHEWPGFALQAIDENYAKLAATFNEIRILEKLNNPARAYQLEQLKNDAIFHMGVLAHFVEDIAQPLHTTVYYNGWEGDNPNGYTTEHKIHYLIDSGLEQHNLTYEELKKHAKYDTKVNAHDTWDDVQKYFLRSHALVERVYQLERDGQLAEEPGRQLIIDRATDAAAMLAAMYNAAWESAKPTEKQIRNWVKYNNFRAASRIAEQKQKEAK